MAKTTITEPQRAFSLVELLVVTGIIAILAGMIMPALSGARERARRANCRSNLRQIGYAIEMYNTGHGRMPAFTSTLYPDYLQSREIYICPSDPYQGMAGSKPPSPPWADPHQYPETNELPTGQGEVPPFILRNAVGNMAGHGDWEKMVYGDSDRYVSQPWRWSDAGDGYDGGYQVEFAGTRKEPWEFRNQDLEGASYLYEFSVAAVPPDAPGQTYWQKHDDAVRGDIVTWQDFKMEEVKVMGTRVPVLRCFFHTSPDSAPADLMINLGYHHGVYDSGLMSPYGWEDRQ